MHVYGQMTAWKTHGADGAPRGARAWWRPFRQWWAARQAIRRRAALASFNASWNPRRETVQPLAGGAAADVAAVQGTLSTATRLHEFSL